MRIQGHDRKGLCIESVTSPMGKPSSGQRGKIQKGKITKTGRQRE